MTAQAAGKTKCAQEQPDPFGPAIGLCHPIQPSDIGTIPAHIIPDPPVRISIILPARNEAAGLAKTLPAIAQYCSDTEIIVVDDGSTDETPRITQEHGASVRSSLPHIDLTNLQD